MRFTIHVQSALIGAGVVALVGLAVAAQGPIKREVVQIPAPATALGPGPIQIAGIPAARDIVQFDTFAPYTVPSGKRLVIRDIGMNGQHGLANSVGVWIDGVRVWVTDFPDQNNGKLADHFAVGLRAEPGSVVTITHEPSNTSAHVAGYLSDV